MICLRRLRARPRRPRRHPRAYDAVRRNRLGRRVTRATAAAGLQFVIVTDHGDGTRAPDLPDYRNGVLYIDAVEISTQDGHVVALDLPKTPYPLAGEGRDVVDDIHRLGGFAIAAHPGSAKPELRWTAWDAPVDGIEWLNADSEWRDERPWTLARALDDLSVSTATGAGAAARSSRAGHSSLGRALSTASCRRHRRGRCACARGYPPRSASRTTAPARCISRRMPLPSASSRSHCPTSSLTGVAAADARRVLDAIRAGAVYSTIDALAGTGGVQRHCDKRLQHRDDGRDAGARGSCSRRGSTRRRLHDARITLFRNGAPVATGQGMRPRARCSGGTRLSTVLKSPCLVRRDRRPFRGWFRIPIYVGRGPVSVQPVRRRRKIGIAAASVHNALRRRHSPRLDGREERGIRCGHRHHWRTGR